MKRCDLEALRLALCEAAQQVSDRIEREYPREYVSRRDDPARHDLYDKQGTIAIQTRRAVDGAALSVIAERRANPGRSIEVSLPIEGLLASGLVVLKS